MSRTTTLLILGVLIFLSPFLGLPLSWLSWILPALGLAVVACGLSLRQSRVREQMRAAAPAQAVVVEEVIEVVEPEQGAF